MTIKARAKINLALDVTGKRADGYHELRMIMQTLSLYDEITMEKSGKPGISISINLPWLPVDERNLVYKAIALLTERYGIKSGVNVTLRKTIPVGAGLAGGSSDCASALRGMKALFDLPISESELYKLGESLGSDVPFCLLGGTALAWGKGEQLQKLTPHPPVTVVLAKPPISVSTASVFKKLDVNAIADRPDVDGLLVCLERQDLSAIASYFGNVLEQVTEKKYPLIIQLKLLLLQKGALGALMTGSGPTVFGYFLHKEEAKEAIREIKGQYPAVKELFLTSVYP